MNSVRTSRFTVHSSSEFVFTQGISPDYDNIKELYRSYCDTFGDIGVLGPNQLRDESDCIGIRPMSIPCQSRDLLAIGPNNERGR